MATEVVPAEFLGVAEAPGRRLVIGGIEVPVWSERVPVFVRRSSADLAIVEVELTRHDGPAEEEIEFLNFEADRYPLGPKEYWRCRR